MLFSIEELAMSTWNSSMMNSLTRPRRRRPDSLVTLQSDSCGSSHSSSQMESNPPKGSNTNYPKPEAKATEDSNMNASLFPVQPNTDIILEQASPSIIPDLNQSTILNVDSGKSVRDSHFSEEKKEEEMIAERYYPRLHKMSHQQPDPPELTPIPLLSKTTSFAAESQLPDPPSQSPFAFMMSRSSADSPNHIVERDTALPNTPTRKVTSDWPSRPPRGTSPSHSPPTMHGMVSNRLNKGRSALTSDVALSSKAAVRQRSLPPDGRLATPPPPPPPPLPPLPSSPKPSFQQPPSLQQHVTSTIQSLPPPPSSTCSIRQDCMSVKPALATPATANRCLTPIMRLRLGVEGETCENGFDWNATATRQAGEPPMISPSETMETETTRHTAEADTVNSVSVQESDYEYEVIPLSKKKNFHHPGSRNNGLRSMRLRRTRQKASNGTVSSAASSTVGLSINDDASFFFTSRMNCSGIWSRMIPNRCGRLEDTSSLCDDSSDDEEDDDDDEYNDEMSSVNTEQTKKLTGTTQCRFVSFDDENISSQDARQKSMPEINQTKDFKKTDDAPEESKRALPPEVVQQDQQVNAVDVSKIVASSDVCQVEESDPPATLPDKSIGEGAASVCTSHITDTAGIYHENQPLQSQDKSFDSEIESATSKCSHFSLLDDETIQTLNHGLHFPGVSKYMEDERDYNKREKQQVYSDRHEDDDPLYPTINLDEVDVEDSNFIKIFLSLATTTGIPFLYHAPPQVKQKPISLLSPTIVSVRIQFGEGDINGDFVEPRMIWSSSDGGFPMASLELFDIESIHRASCAELRFYPSALSSKSVIVSTEQGEDYMFEALDERIASRFVEGMRTIIARLAVNLISGDANASFELLDVHIADETVSYDALVKHSRMKFMNDVMNHLVNKSHIISSYTTIK